MTEAVIAVHGGAGGWSAGHEEAAAALEAALRDGEAALREGADALTAVQAAVEVLEDAPILNAGRGALPTASGAYELDAAIMEGATRRAGAVAAVRGVRHPVALARTILDSPHVFVVAEGARALAEEAGLEIVADDWFRTDVPSQPHIDPATPGGTAPPPAPTHSSPHGTVGAVALDSAGRLASATSTGGRMGQVDGRVGDAPLIGAGTYADGLCGVSATGDGEELTRIVAGHHVATLVRYGRAIEHACDAALDELRKLDGTAGLIAVDTEGTVALRFTTEAMARGFMRAGGDPFVAVRA